MRNTDNAYDDFISSHGDDAVKAMKAFEESVGASNVKFGRFTIPTFFKAQFITPEQEHILKHMSDVLLKALNKVVNLYFTENSLKHTFGIRPEADELMQVDPGYARTASIVRLDSFMDADSIKIVEFNCDSPAGVGYADELEELMFRSDLFKAFSQERALKREHRRKCLLDTLLSAYAEFGGAESKPHIAIVDWRTVRTQPEFELLEAYFKQEGYETEICDPRDLTYTQGRLMNGTFKIDIVYRRVIFNELLAKIDECGELVKAYKARAVCMVNPLRSRLAATKAVLSIMTNPEYDHYFTDEENDIKTRHIPWTRRIVDAEKFYGGRKIYLLDFLKDEKDTLVLKPSDGYGGRDVTIGRETTNDDWNKTIDKALKSDWVVQEYVNIPTMSVPVVINGKLEFALKKVNLNPFALGGRYSGSVSRLSDDSVINVSHGGGLVPALAVDDIHHR